MRHQGGREHSFTKADRYRSPFTEINETGLPEWLHPILSTDNRSAMADAIYHMCDRLGRVCSGSQGPQAHHLFPHAGDATDVAEDEEGVIAEGETPEAAEVVAENDIVDAFSPWYQVEPRARYRITGDSDDETKALSEDCARLKKRVPQSR